MWQAESFFFAEKKSRQLTYIFGRSAYLCRAKVVVEMAKGCKMLFLSFFLLGLFVSASMGRLSAVPSTKAFSLSASTVLSSFDNSPQNHRGFKAFPHQTDFASGPVKGVTKCCLSTTYYFIMHGVSSPGRHVFLCRFQI